MATRLSDLSGLNPTRLLPGSGKGLHALLFTLSISWALFVLFAYAQVDKGFLLEFLDPNSSTLVQSGPLLKVLSAGPEFLMLILMVLGMSFALAYAVGKHFRSWAWLWLFGAAVGGYWLWSSSPSAQDAFWNLNRVGDNFRAFFVIIVAAIVGIGYGLGFRWTKSEPPLWFIGLSIGLPFLITAMFARAILNLLAIVWLFLLAEAIGFQLLRFVVKFSADTQASLDKAGVLTVAVGLACLSLVTLILGLLGFASPIHLVLFLLLATALFFRRIKVVLTRLVGQPWKKTVSVSIVGLSALVMLVALFAMFWVGALAPETGPDAIGFRVAGPVIWLREGRVTPLPEMMGSYGFFAAEMLYFLVMPLAGLTAAKVVSLGLGGLLIIGTFAQVFAFRLEKSLTLCMFAFWSSTIVWWQMIAGFADLTQAFFYFGALLAVRLWLDEPSAVWLVAAGILGATATIIKLNGAGVLAIAGAIVIGVTVYRTRDARILLRNGLYLIVPFLLPVFPWLLRSYILTQNPIFPFANQVFKSPLAPAQFPSIQYGPGLTFPNILKVPWDIFFDPGRFAELGTYNPFLLTIFPLALIGFIGVRRKDVFWFATGGVAALGWLVTDQNIRYSLYAGYVLSIALAIGLGRLSESFSSTIVRYVFQTLMLTGLVFGFGIQILRPTMWMWRASSSPGLPTQVVFGNQTEADYLKQNVQTFACADWMNKNYGGHAKVWQVPPLRDHLYFTAHAFALPHGILPVTQPLNELLTDPKWINNPDATYHRLLELGYTHLMYWDQVSWVANTPEDRRKSIFSPNFERAYLQLECTDRGIRLYRINPSAEGN